MVTTTTLREQYRNLTDEHLIRIAVHESDDLTPEAETVLGDELLARGLSEQYLQIVKARATVRDERPSVRLLERLRVCPCPECGSTQDRLNARYVARAMSFLIVTTYRKDILVACPACIRSKAVESLAISALIGWWGLPWGPIRAIQSIWINSKSISLKVDYSAPSQELQDLVRQNPAYALSIVEQYEAESAQPRAEQE